MTTTIENEMEQRVIPGLEAAKALRVVCPYARQLGALAKYINTYNENDSIVVRAWAGWEKMLDEVAAEFCIDLNSYYRSIMDKKNMEHFGKHLTKDLLPAYLDIICENGVGLDIAYAMLQAEREEIFLLKDKALFVASKVRELRCVSTGFIDDICWYSVRWHKRDFLFPASAQAASKCIAVNQPPLPVTCTGALPHQARNRHVANEAKALLVEYLNQHEEELAGFDAWMRSRNPGFLKKKGRND